MHFCWPTSHIKDKLSIISCLAKTSYKRAMITKYSNSKDLVLLYPQCLSCSKQCFIYFAIKQFKLKFQFSYRIIHLMTSAMTYSGHIPKVKSNMVTGAAAMRQVPFVIVHLPRWRRNIAQGLLFPLGLLLSGMYVHNFCYD